VIEFRKTSTQFWHWLIPPFCILLSIERVERAYSTAVFTQFQTSILDSEIRLMNI